MQNSLRSISCFGVPGAAVDAAFVPLPHHCCQEVMSWFFVFCFFVLRVKIFFLSLVFSGLFVLRLTGFTCIARVWASLSCSAAQRTLAGVQPCSPPTPPRPGCPPGCFLGLCSICAPPSGRQAAPPASLACCQHCGGDRKGWATLLRPSLQPPRPLPRSCSSAGALGGHPVAAGEG